jgi:hypothetical protein
LCNESSRIVKESLGTVCTIEKYKTKINKDSNTEKPLNNNYTVVKDEIQVWTDGSAKIISNQLQASWAVFFKKTHI